MKKFVFKLSYFAVPFLLLYFVNLLFYVPSEGDLVQVGYLYSNPSPKSIIEHKFKLQKKYTEVSEIESELESKKIIEFSVLTIGDSFSGQFNLGYKNYLANEKNTSVLYVDRYITGNPIQTLINLINGDFFDYIHVEYIVLQSVERYFVERCENIDFRTSFQKDSLINLIKNHKRAKQKNDIIKQKIDLFSDATIKCPLVNMQYYFTPLPVFSKTYKVKSINKTLFTNEPDNILFYKDDISKLEFSNDVQKIKASNHVINVISESLLNKNIKLILLISPDKYDLYYPYIKKNYNLDEPMFFKYFNKLDKKYLYTSLKDKFYKNDEIIKDVYYYDDTHWSPIGAKITATEISKLMNGK
jgi:hypothetical protein